MRQHGIRLFMAAVAAVLFTFPMRAEDACPATTAHGAVTQVEVKNGQVLASGTWEVGGSAAGALLEFRFDNDRRQAEMRTNTSGTFSIAESFTTCDRPLHAIRVFVFPAVKQGDEQLKVCLKQFVRSDLKQFEIACGAQVEVDHCTWECEDGNPPMCAGMCSVAASGGRLPYLLFQSVGDGKEQQVGDNSSQGHWTPQLTCKRGEKVSFFVKDYFGRGRPSPKAEWVCGQD